MCKIAFFIKYFYVFHQMLMFQTKCVLLPTKTLVQYITLIARRLVIYIIRAIFCFFVVAVRDYDDDFPPDDRRDRPQNPTLQTQKTNTKMVVPN